MQNILSLLQKGLEICFKFRHIDLKGFCFRTLCHCFIKHIKGHGLPQIIRVYRSIHNENRYNGYFYFESVPTINPPWNNS